MIKKLAQSISPFVFRSRPLARFLFGIDFCSRKKEDYYFDITTVGLVKKVKKDINPNSCVLDMGAGSFSIIGLWLWKHIHCPVIASDVHPEIAASARENIRKNGASFPVRESRFFENINDAFDVVVFNPPYVATGSGKIRKLSGERMCQWDGGEHGISVIREFLDAFAQLKRPVIAYMGVNTWHVPAQTIIAVLNGIKGILVQEVYRDRLLPVTVFVLQRKFDVNA